MPQGMGVQVPPRAPSFSEADAVITCRPRQLAAILLRRQRSDDLSEPRIVPYRIPNGVESQLAVVHVPRYSSGDGEPFDRGVLVIGPSINCGEIFDQNRAINGLLGNWQRLRRSPAFPDCFLFAAKSGINHPQDT